MLPLPIKLPCKGYHFLKITAYWWESESPVFKIYKYFFMKIVFLLGGSSINLFSLISISPPWSGWKTREAIVQDTHSWIGYEPCGPMYKAIIPQSTVRWKHPTFQWLVGCYCNPVWAISLWRSHDLPASYCPVISLGSRTFCASSTSSLLSSDAGELAPNDHIVISRYLCY